LHLCSGLPYHAPPPTKPFNQAPSATWAPLAFPAAQAAMAAQQPRAFALLAPMRARFDCNCLFARHCQIPLDNFQGKPAWLLAATCHARAHGRPVSSLLARCSLLLLSLRERLPPAVPRFRFRLILALVIRGLGDQQPCLMHIREIWSTSTERSPKSKGHVCRCCLVYM
jgi:hypothetical protein